MTRRASIIVGALALLVGIAGIAIAILAPASGSRAPVHPEGISVVEPSGGATVTQVPAGAPQVLNAPHAKRTTAPRSAGPIKSKPPVDAQATAITTPSPVGAKGPHRHYKVANPDGCNRAYGTADQCIPKRQPGGKRVDCAFLTSNGFFRVPLVVHGDPLKLMSKPHVSMYTDTLGRMVIASCSDT